MYKNVNFCWQADLEVCFGEFETLLCQTVVEFGSAMLTAFRAAVASVRMPWTNFLFFVSGAILVSQNIEKGHFVLGGFHI